MRKGFVWLSVAAGAAVGVLFSGCSPKDAAPDAPPVEEAPADTTAAAEAASVESAASAMVESANAAKEEGGAEMKEVAVEAEKEAEAVAVQQQAAAMKEKAAALVAQYAPQLETLKSSASSIKALIDKHADMLPAGMGEKYQELNALLPQLTQLVDSLKNYEGGDLASLASSLPGDFEKSQSLLAELKAMLPANLM